MQLFSSWTGSDFLFFYIALLGLSGFAAWWGPAHLRAGGRRGASPDAESLALLAGGRARFAESLLADLYVRGGITVGSDGKLVVADRRVLTSPAGRAVLSADGPLTLTEARALLRIHGERRAAHLRRSGLLLRPEEVARLRWLSVAPFAALLVLGVYRQRAGATLGEPTGFLIALMVVTAGIALWRFLSIDPRTQAGITEVARQKVASAGLARAPQPDEVPLAVALFGTGVLIGTPWEPLHALRQPSSSRESGGGGDSSSDGSSDGGSDGGGGCGGCGG